jgi:hypothetical protein
MMVSAYPYGSNEDMGSSVWLEESSGVKDAQTNDVSCFIEEADSWRRVAGDAGTMYAEAKESNPDPTIFPKNNNE